MSWTFDIVWPYLVFQGQFDHCPFLFCKILATIKASTTNQTGYYDQLYTKNYGIGIIIGNIHSRMRG